MKRYVSLSRRLQVEQQVDHLRLNRDVQGRDRLVRDDERRFERERPRQADALALPAAELVRIALEVRRIETDQAEELRHRVAPFGAVPSRWMMSGSSTMSRARMRGFSDEYGS